MSTTEPIPAALRTALAAEGNHCTRAFTVDSNSINVEARTVELAFASETPCLRAWGYEILDCRPAAIRGYRLNNGANLLLEHCPDDVVGVVESFAAAADRVVRSVVRFGKGAEASEVFQDVIDRIRRNVSVTYVIHQAVRVEDIEGVAAYRIIDWEPLEISLVAIPFDPRVGVGRSHAPATVAPAPIPAITSPQEKSMSTVPLEAPAAAAAPAAATAAAAPQVQTIETRNHAKEIADIGAQLPGSDELVRRSIQAGHTVEQFLGEVQKRFNNRPLPTADLGLTPKEQQRYSVLRAIRAMVDRDWKGAGFELECSNEILKRGGLQASPNGGFMVPYDVQKRDLTAASPSGGGYLVATDNLGGSFIDLLRNRALVARFGATFLTGLQGNITIPKQTGAATAYWLSSESTAITESQQTLGQLALSPKHIGAMTELSRQIMMQSSPAADALVLNDLAKGLGLGIDTAALNGSGASGQPTGLLNTAGIGTVSGSSLGYAGIVEFQTDVAGSNALVGNCGYMTTPTVAGLLKLRQRFTSTDTPLWQGNILDGTIEGFKASSTLQMPSATMVFGDWSQIVIGEWGSLEIALNPYANFAAAITGIRAIQTCDVGVRIAGAFSVATSIT